MSLYNAENNIILCPLFYFFQTKVISEDWSSHWQKGLELGENFKYEEAEKEFSTSINLLSKQERQDFAFVLIDRGRLYFAMDKLDLSIKDLTEALKSPSLSVQDRNTALMTRMLAYADSKMEKEAEVDYEFLKNKTNFFAICEFLEDKIIIRNAPCTPCFKSMIGNAYIKLGMCKSLDDLTFYSNDVLVVKLAPKDENSCGCGCGGKKKAIKKIIT